MVANRKRRKTKIFQLEQDGELIQGQENLKRVITKYNKGVFGSSQRNDFSLNESQVGDIPQVSELENELLTEDFTEK